MSFKQGKFFAISGTNQAGERVYLEANATSSHQERLRQIARKASRSRSGYGYDDDYDDVSDEAVSSSSNPFGVKIWDAGSSFSIIMTSMRHIRKHCGVYGIDPNSLRLEVVETSVTPYTPESPSDEETEMRRFVLEKLSREEQELLKVTHWSVYNKLADRSMLEDDEDVEQ